MYEKEGDRMKKLNKIRLILVFALCAFFIGFAQVYAKDPTTKYGRFLNSGDGQNHGINFDIRLTIAGVSGFIHINSMLLN